MKGHKRLYFSDKGSITSKKLLQGVRGIIMNLNTGGEFLAKH